MTKHYVEITPFSVAIDPALTTTAQIQMLKLLANQMTKMRLVGNAETRSTASVVC